MLTLIEYNGHCYNVTVLDIKEESALCGW